MAKRPHLHLDRVKDAAGAAGDAVGGVASVAGSKLGDAADVAGDGLVDALHATSHGAANLAGRAKTSVGTKRLPKERQVDLTGMAPAAKLLYCRILVAESRIDGVPDPRELANLYLFASTIQLDAESRSLLRADIAARADGDTGVPDVPALAQELTRLIPDADRPAVLTMLVRDLLRLARVDLDVASAERGAVVAVAEMACPGKGELLVIRTGQILDEEQAFLEGRISESELSKRTKDLVAGGAAIGVPLAALGAAGTLGYSAVGITSGLAALGFGGVLGFSAMVTGIGTVIILGIAAYSGTKFILNVRRRGKASRREALVQQVLRNHEEAIEDLRDDVARLAKEFDEIVARRKRSEARLAQLRQELTAFEAALANLTASRDLFAKAGTGDAS